jgi:hypothetical protein
MYHWWIVLSVGGSVWYVVRNLRCTFTIDSVFANSSAFLFSVHTMFHHDCTLVVKPASMPRHLVHKKNLGEILYLLICSPSAWPSWLLYCRGQKSRRDLWITLYTLYCRIPIDSSLWWFWAHITALARKQCGLFLLFTSMDKMTVWRYALAHG